MKKKILGGIAIVAIATVAAWNVNFNSHGTFSDGSMVVCSPGGNISPCFAQNCPQGTSPWY